MSDSEETVICQECGKANPAQQCPVCGISICFEDCPECGHDIRPEPTVECLTCGKEAHVESCWSDGECHHCRDLRRKSERDEKRDA